MKRVFLVLLALSACSKTAPTESGYVRGGKPYYSVMSAEGVIVGKPTLVRSGIRPLTIDEARPYMSNMFSELVPVLEKTNITYQMQGNDIVLMIQAHLIFDSREDFRADMIHFLDQMAAVIASNSRTFVEFQGHAADAGSLAANQRKSGYMAQKIGDFFMDRGVMPARVFISGQGKSRWVADNRTREGKLLNTRIEIRITPLI